MKNRLLISVGMNIRKERIRQGLSQEELAIKAGVHRTYIGMIERGEKNTTLISLGKIAKGLGITISKILGGN
ncbi:helix-turn-helix domain-containing protein [Chloroflexota bacterium]